MCDFTVNINVNCVFTLIISISKLSDRPKLNFLDGQLSSDIIIIIIIVGFVFTYKDDQQTLQC